MNSGRSARKSGLQREQPRERLVEEDQAAVAAELGDSGREPVEHVALGVDEAGELGARLLAILDVDRIAGDAGLAERHLDHPHHPPLAGDGRGHGARMRLAALANRGGLAERRSASPSSTSSMPPSTTAAALLRLDRGDIGAVDHGEAKIGPAMPDRERRRLDQAGQGVERGGEPLVRWRASAAISSSLSVASVNQSRTDPGG